MHGDSSARMLACHPVPHAQVAAASLHVGSCKDQLEPGSSVAFGVSIPPCCCCFELIPAALSGVVSLRSVAYQGVPGAYSEMAALKACPGWEPLPCEQFETAFQALSQVSSSVTHCC